MCNERWPSQSSCSRRWSGGSECSWQSDLIQSISCILSAIASRRRTLLCIFALDTWMFIRERRLPSIGTRADCDIGKKEETCNIPKARETEPHKVLTIPEHDRRSCRPNHDTYRDIKKKIQRDRIPRTSLGDLHRGAVMEPATTNHHLSDDTKASTLDKYHWKADQTNRQNCAADTDEQILHQPGWEWSTTSHYVWGTSAQYSLYALTKFWLQFYCHRIAFWSERGSTDFSMSPINIHDWLSPSTYRRNTRTGCIIMQNIKDTVHNF